MATHAHSSAPTQPLTGNEWRVLGTLAPYLWEYRWRVILAMSFLVAAKLANVSVPLVMKEVVDGLDPRTAMLAVPLALLAAYGLLRFANTLFIAPWSLLARNALFMVVVLAHGFRRLGPPY